MTSNDRKPPPNEVTEASEESFPASDPPAYTGVRAGRPADHPQSGGGRRQNKPPGATGEPAGEAPRRGPTPSQLRDAIDRGETGDKVAGGDPAAAPLGTDEEAAGAAPSSAAVAAALDAERREETPTARTPGGAEARTPRRRVTPWILLGIGAAAVIWWAAS